jgi:hypothetical protein
VIKVKAVPVFGTAFFLPEAMEQILICGLTTEIWLIFYGQNKNTRV